MLVTDNATVSEIYLKCQDLLLFILKDNPRALIDISDDFVVEVKKADDTNDTGSVMSVVSYSTDEGDYTVSGYYNDYNFGLVHFSRLFLYTEDTMKNVIAGIEIEKDRDFNDVRVMGIQVNSCIPIETTCLRDKRFLVEDWERLIGYEKLLKVIKSIKLKGFQGFIWVIDYDGSAEVVFSDDGSQDRLDPKIMKSMLTSIPKKRAVHSITFKYPCNGTVYERKSRVRGEYDVLIY